METVEKQSNRGPGTPKSTTAKDKNATAKEKDEATLKRAKGLSHK